MIRKDGYYISEKFPWVDWHAGHKFEGNTYYILVFFDDNKVLRISQDSMEFNIIELLENSNPKDYYNVYKNKLEIIIDPASEWWVKKDFTILSPEILIDENLKEYRYTPINKSV